MFPLLATTVMFAAVIGTETLALLPNTVNAVRTVFATNDKLPDPSVFNTCPDEPSALIPMLVKAIQELSAKVKVLEG